MTHKHTQYPGPGRTEDNVVSFPVGPVYAAKAGGFFFIVLGFLSALAGMVQINALWNYGPYDPSPVQAGTQPDWYILFGDGALRLFPGTWPWNWEWNLFGLVTIPLAVFIPLMIMGALIGAIFAYPFLERWISGDSREHHVLDRPRNAPTRTGLGAAAVVFYSEMMVAASSDLIATHFHLSLIHI